MKNRLVVIQNTKNVIQKSGWAKKGLASCHIELSALCAFGCRYCSSNSAVWLRINSQAFLAATVEQLGEPLTPKENPELAYVWREDVVGRLEAELRGKPKSFGVGQTLALSQATDPLSPVIDPRVAQAVIKLLIEKTSFRIRLLTKNAQIGSEAWIAFLKDLGSRVVVSLSIGNLDPEWSRRIEIGTSTPRARLRALRQLQDAGVPTYGMLCPIFPQVLDSGMLDELIDAIRPDLCEHVWAEPYNDRDNWSVVRDGYDPGSAEYNWFDRVYGEPKGNELWSDYATRLFEALHARAVDGGWFSKLRYMLYEAHVSAEHVPRFGNLEGIMLQSVDKRGLSKNAHFRRVQEEAQPEHVGSAMRDPVPSRALPTVQCLPAVQPCSVPAAAACVP